MRGSDSLLQASPSKAMLEGMKNTILKILLISALVSTYAVSAELYRGVDSEGNVIYSDTPFEDAEKYSPPPISVMDAPKAASKKKVVEEEKPAEFKYTKFDIESPENEQTIRNDPDVKVSVNLVPELNFEAGHSIWLFIDGQPVVKNGQDTSFYIGRVDRGAHKLQAQVRDTSGKIIVRSRTNVIYIHNTSGI